MQCVSCGFENPEGMKFCGECGVPFKHRCPQCGFENLPRFKFCGECGTFLSSQPQPPVSSSRFQAQESSKSEVQSPESETEECFLKAIEIARKQQAKSLELRATVSLAQLRKSQGKQHAARNTLSEIYGWFTEGFDTKDLQEAKALLDELT